jgi:hypothetical protein
MPASRSEPATAGYAVVAALACVIAVLAGIGWRVVHSDPNGDRQTITPAPRKRDAPPIVIAVRPEPPAEADPILTRPVLFPYRRPWTKPEPVATEAPAAAAPEPVALSPPNVIVDGIYLGVGDRVAHFRRPGDAKGDWLKEGDLIEGWTIRRLHAESVELENAGCHVRLDLYPLAASPDGSVDPNARARP